MKKLNHHRILAFTLIVIFTFPAFGQKKNQSKNSETAAKIPVVLIHGIGGSNLRQPSKGLRDDGGFPNDVLRGPAGNPRNLQFTSRGEPRADSLSKSVIADGFYDVPGKNITDLTKYLVSEKGYALKETVFEFAYDFRYSVMYNAAKLGEFIDRIKEETKQAQVDVVGHSMGGLVAKAYLLDSEKAANVRNLIFVGTPHLGAPKALKALRYGDNLEVFLINACKLKRAAHNFPGMYNLLPGRRYFEAAKSGYFFDDDDLDKDGVRGLLDFDQTLHNLKNGVETKCVLNPEVDVMPGDAAMLTDRLNAEMIDRDAVQFHDALDAWRKPAGVTVFNIVGYGVRTIENIREAGGKITFGETTEGDGTVPLWSAEAVESDAIYYVNLNKLDTEHSAMIGNKNINLQITELMEKGANIYISETSGTRPTSIRFSKKTRGFKTN